MNFFKKLFLYATLPEMRLFWIVLPLIGLIVVINYLYLTELWLLASIGIFLILIFVILFNSLRLARYNFEIKIERNELSSIIFNLRDGIIAYDPNFKILILNRAAEKIFNVTAQEVVGQHFSPTRAEESKFKLLVQVMFPSLAPVVVKRSEGEDFPQMIDLSFEDLGSELRVITDKIIDPQGVLLGFMKIVHDRTREVRLLRSKTEFISIAAHQLRTPLSAVHWALESLKKSPLKGEERETVESGFGAVLKLLKTVNDLLDVSKIEEGRFGYDFEEVDIISFIREIMGEVKELHKKSTVELYFDKPKESSILVSLDKQKMRIALLNLLDNAIKYNVLNGEIVVSIRRRASEPYVEISIKDTGIGVSAGEMEKLFSKFFRAENAIKASPEGTGLGLYIVKNIIKRHGGDIWVKSELNRGSTFYFTLPTNPDLIPPKEVVFGEE